MVIKSSEKRWHPLSITGLRQKEDSKLSETSVNSCFFEKGESGYAQHAGRCRGAMQPHTNNFLPHYCGGDTDCANVNIAGAEPALAFTELDPALHRLLRQIRSLSGVDRRRFGNPVSYEQLRRKGSEGDLEEHWPAFRRRRRRRSRLQAPLYHRRAADGTVVFPRFSVCKRPGMRAGLAPAAEADRQRCASVSLLHGLGVRIRVFEQLHKGRQLRTASKDWDMLRRNGRLDRRRGTLTVSRACTSTNRNAWFRS